MKNVELAGNLFQSSQRSAKMQAIADVQREMGAQVFRLLSLQPEDFPTDEELLALAALL